jgi:hypothetical protein
MKPNGRHVATDIALGALAGAAATWVMGKATTYLYEHEDEAVRHREDEARGGRTAYVVAAGRAAAAVGRTLDEEQENKLGAAIHWGLGVGAGAFYGAMRGRIPGADWGQGTAFGAAFWLVVDETANPVLGLTPGPAAFPWQTHARGLAGHLVFGVVADTVLDLADAVR